MENWKFKKEHDNFYVSYYEGVFSCNTSNSLTQCAMPYFKNREDGEAFIAEMGEERLKELFNTDILQVFEKMKEQELTINDLVETLEICRNNFDHLCEFQNLGNVNWFNNYLGKENTGPLELQNRNIALSKENEKLKAEISVLKNPAPKATVIKGQTNGSTRYEPGVVIPASDVNANIAEIEELKGILKWAREDAIAVLNNLPKLIQDTRSHATEHVMTHSVAPSLKKLIKRIEGVA